MHEFLRQSADRPLCRAGGWRGSGRRRQVLDLEAALGRPGRGRARLGLERSREEQIAALRAQVDTIDFDAADAYERRFRHDVMAHIHALGDAAPVARPIIHLGATSCYVTDNADLILMRAALELVRDKTVAAIDALAVVRRDMEGIALPGLHPLPARATGDGRQAGDALVLRAGPRPARDRAPAGRA